MRQIITRKQAVTLLVQLDKNVSEINLFLPVDDNHKYFKLTNEEMENKIAANRNMNSESIAGVVDF